MNLSGSVNDVWVANVLIMVLGIKFISLPMSRSLFELGQDSPSWLVVFWGKSEPEPLV